MSTDGNAHYEKNIFVLTIKGDITVQFIPGIVDREITRSHDGIAYRDSYCFARSVGQHIATYVLDRGQSTPVIGYAVFGEGKMQVTADRAPGRVFNDRRYRTVIYK